MSTYEVKGTKQISFVDHTGVSFIKDQTLAQAEVSPDVEFVNGAGGAGNQWAIAGSATITGGQAIIPGDSASGSSVFAGQGKTGLAIGDTYTCKINVSDINAGLLEIRDYNNGVSATITTNGVTTFTGTIAGAGPFNALSLTNGTTVVIESLSILKDIAGSQEILTGPFTTIETSPSQNLRYNNVNWAVAQTQFDIVTYDYDGLGNYEDNSFAPDPAVPMAAQTIILKNCLAPARPYIPSIYAGTKNIDGTERLATGVTQVQVSNVVGAGTVDIYVDSVFVGTLNTLKNTEFNWAVSGVDVSWIMTGVTQFDLGQGK